MGYGGSAADAGRALGRSGDDGVIDQDALGLDRVYFQAKRYAEATTSALGRFGIFLEAPTATRQQGPVCDHLDLLILGEGNGRIPQQTNCPDRR
jgi:hypothetical protein